MQKASIYVAYVPRWPLTLQLANINRKTNRKQITLFIVTHHFSALAMCSWASFIFWAAILLVNSMGCDLLSIRAMDVVSSTAGLPGCCSRPLRHPKSQATGAAEHQKEEVTQRNLCIIYETKTIMEFYLYYVAWFGHSSKTKLAPRI